jgi:hypothetical protein
VQVAAYEARKFDGAPWRRKMYGLSKKIDLSFLNDRECIQIAVGMFQVQFRFDEDVSISVEGEFSYFDGREELVWKPGACHRAASTVALLGASIRIFEGQSSGTLTLNFSNGHRLVISDSSQEFESYSIARPGHTIVV